MTLTILYLIIRLVIVVSFLFLILRNALAVWVPRDMRLMAWRRVILILFGYLSLPAVVVLTLILCIFIWPPSRRFKVAEAIIPRARYEHGP